MQGVVFFTIYKNVSFKFVCFFSFSIFFQLDWIFFQVDWIFFQLELSKFSFMEQLYPSYISFIAAQAVLNYKSKCKWRFVYYKCVTFQANVLCQRESVKALSKSFRLKRIIRPRSPRYRQYTCDLLYFDIYVCVDLLPWTLLKL